jgi:16S rRNA (cytosine967-C5)-methyltransferase
MNVRAAATHMIVDVIYNGRSLSTVDVPTKISERDHSLLQAICYGVCRWYFRLDAIAKLLLEKPLKQKDQDIYVLILIGLYQLIEMRIPDYAAVGETVAATKSLKKIWAKNLVNGVLRQYQRNAESLNNKLNNNLMANFSHPHWMIEKIRQDWPLDWEFILEHNNQHPPFALRINNKFHSREMYLSSLAFDNSLIPETVSGIILDKAIDVDQLPGFRAGHISVQDGAAQLAATLLMLEPGQRVLDACAAPGGKTAHMLELEPEIAELIAM